MIEYDSETEYSDVDAKKVEVRFAPVTCSDNPDHALGVTEIPEDAEGWCHCGKPLKKGRAHKVKIGK